MSIAASENTIQVEMLCIEQFAERLKISRSTAYNWLAEGRLVTGRHVLHIGRVVRVLWSDDLVSYLLSLSEMRPEKIERSRLKRNGKGGRNIVALDLEYLELAA